MENALEHARTADHAMIADVELSLLTAHNQLVASTSLMNCSEAINHTKVFGSNVCS